MPPAASAAASAAPEVDAPDPNRARIASLDWARGWMLIASVTVNSLIVVPPWFDHAPWNGVHPIDVIFPVFVTLSGCGLAFAMTRTVKVAPLLRRVAVLFVVGLAYNAIVEWSLDVFTWRITGVLQLYAVLVAVIGLLHVVTKSWQGWAAITALTALAQTTLLTVYATTCSAHVLTPECNPSGPIDSAIFGAAHIYRLGAAGHDPEGLIAIMGAVVSASAGATVGHLLLATRRRALGAGRGPETAIGPVLLSSAGFIALAIVLIYSLPILLGVQLPIMKRLWTAPFALVVAAGTALLLLVGHLLLDRARVPLFVERASYPLLALGRNSLLVYFGSHVLMSLLTRPIGQSGTSVAARVTDVLAYVGPPQLLWTLLLLGFWIGLASLLHRHRIYLRP
ncbi:heparan-alpha-glucosaminide N-acetyltransferase domain-containing protein [Microbacterium gallinarum]|uniref:DUF1624 domain-containing protein n=1 Tax=Microbacterium gallinarum TaxID=2762209 RepID=A0ABR8X097_9MICO|nr:heparan-alpha-glucosaminide N-acetyltransferase domain-containing protein [Microbacterium gallinarum]MBD8022266.1 DUF1624 domain-containing protein [Microbacterium gallinarum]